MNTTFDPLSWGNRRELLAKRMTYAFSLDINVAMEASMAKNGLVPVCWPPGPERRMARARSAGGSEVKSNIYRVANSGEFVTSGGLRPDVPFARLLHADDQIVQSNRITGDLAGRLLFETDTTDLLRMDYTGVINFKGWPTVEEPRAASGAPAAETGSPQAKAKNLNFKNVRGTAFVSSRQEIGSPKYRWLVHNQLIGVGRVEPARQGEQLLWSRAPKPRGLGLLLKFSFDFYIGA